MLSQNKDFHRAKNSLPDWEDFLEQSDPSKGGCGEWGGSGDPLGLPGDRRFSRLPKGLEDCKNMLI